MEFKSNINLSDKQKLFLSRELIYQKTESKIELFEKCIDEVGMYKIFPFIDLTRYRIPLFNKIYPVDSMDEILMRNCVQKYMNTRGKIRETLNFITK